MESQTESESAPASAQLRGTIFAPKIMEGTPISNVLPGLLYNAVYDKELGGYIAVSEVKNDPERPLLS